MRPIYVGENPYKGTYKRNHEGDYHATEYEVKGMIRDQNPDGNDSLILEYYTMEDIDRETLKKYRNIFEIRNAAHIWNALDDKSFLEKIGGYRKDRRSNREGLTLAGLLMFGDGLAIRDEFDNIFMDYRDESEVTSDIRWNDRVTYDGTWENNLFNFFMKVTPKLTADLKKPFKLEGMQRIDETPVHKAVREAFVNLIIHSDYLLDAGTLKIIKRSDEFEFTNPGILKLPIDEIFKGGNSKTRNPRMQTMLRMVGFGDNAGSGFPTILHAWKEAGWVMPELIENTALNQVTLLLKMQAYTKEVEKEPKKGAEKEPKKGAEKEPKEGRKQAIIRLLEYNSRLTQMKIAEELQLTRKQVQTEIKELQAAGVLERDGSNRNGHWVIKK